MGWRHQVPQPGPDRGRCLRHWSLRNLHFPDHGPREALQQTYRAAPVSSSTQSPVRSPPLPDARLADQILLCPSIIRILWMVPIYSLVAWLSIFFYHDSVSLQVIGDCYEAFCISAFFSLMCHYIAPDLHSQKDYFRGIQPKTWLWPLSWFQKWKWCGAHRGAWRNPRSGLTWFNVRESTCWGFCNC